MFGHIWRIDQGALWLNLLFLLFCVLLPYPTNLLGEHAPHAVAVIAYALTIAATARASTALWYCVVRRGYLAPNPPPGLIRTTELRLFVIAGVFLVSVPVAFVDGNAAMICWFAIRISNRFIRSYDTGDLGTY